MEIPLKMCLPISQQDAAILLGAFSITALKHNQP